MKEYTSWIVLLSMFAVSLIVIFIFGVGYIRVESERDALKERVAELELLLPRVEVYALEKDWTKGFDSRVVACTLNMYVLNHPRVPEWRDSVRCAEEEMKAVTDSVVAVCSLRVKLYEGEELQQLLETVRANQAWNGGVLIPFKEVDKIETPPTK